MNKFLLVLSILFMILGGSLFIYKIYKSDLYKKEDQKLLIDFFENYKIDSSNETNSDNSIKDSQEVNTSYVAVIEIPEISLKTGIVMSDKDYTTMNRHVSIYPTSDMPDSVGNFVLFAHNGSSSVSYFKNINKLNNDDEIYVYYKGECYLYKVIKKYNVYMTDMTPTYKMDDKTIITLITCQSENNKYRTIVVGELINVE